jgi:hypothetical protein
MGKETEGRNRFDIVNGTGFQEDFGDRQIACAMMSVLFGSEPSPDKCSSRNLDKSVS